MHTPVLLKEAIEGLNVQKGKRYIDATAGGGGHLFEIIKKGGTVLGIELDFNQATDLRDKLNKREVNKNGLIIQASFAEIESIARKGNFFPVEGILFDLGISQNQLFSGRGFSFKFLDDPLDMRINQEQSSSAKDIVNSFDNYTLYELFVRNAEEINARAIADSIVGARSKKKFEKVRDLTEAIDNALGEKSNKTYARVFQALRIEVNNEFGNLRKGLKGALNLLPRGGRLVVIAFHSLEDRIVKRFSKEKSVKLVNKVVGKSKGTFSFERSAVLRVMEK